MARSLFSYGNAASLQREELYEFVNFYLEQAETGTVQEIGYVPSSAGRRDQNLETLEEAAGQ
jgi:phosphate transport system substrate-binding protein